MSCNATQTKKVARSITIRQATAEDLDAIRELLSRRDDRQWDEAATSWFLFDLDPEKCLAWLAMDDDTPVGLSSIFLRELSWKGASHRVAYWANLYIRPDYRDLMLYPRLPMAMFGPLRQNEVEFLYGAVRLREVARAHVGIGFAKLGEIPVLFKPLRPGRLLAKYKQWGQVMAHVSAPGDAVFAALQGVRRPRAVAGVQIEEISPGAEDIGTVVALLNESGGERVRQVWADGAFRYRYRQTREGGRYLILLAQQDGGPVAVLVFRYAERDNQVRACVVMDVAMKPGAEDSATLILAEAERRAYRAGCELMLFLSGLGADIEGVFRSTGYRMSPEIYDLLVWPKTALAPRSSEADSANWRLTFGDHDAF